MRVVHGGDTGPDIEELAYARLTGQVANQPPQERAVGPGQVSHARVGGQSLLGGLTISGEVVLAAKPVVIHPGLMRDAGIEGRTLSRPSSGAVGPPRWWLALAGH
jgi:hypothetical protein